MPGFLYCILLLCAFVRSASAVEVDRLFYLSNGEVLQGLIYKPNDKGPFPAVVYNQNSSKDWSKETNTKGYSDLAQFFTRRGYALFVPSRRKAKGEQEEGAAGGNDDEQQRALVHQHELQTETVFSAIEALKAQSFIDEHRIFGMGYAGGAITSLLMAEKELNVRGYVVFSPAAGWWNKYPLLQDVVKRCTRNAKTPIFLIQPENDHNLFPTEVLGPLLQAKGLPNRSKVYPAFGKSLDDAKVFGMNGASVWGDDVLAFFRQASK